MRFAVSLVEVRLMVANRHRLDGFVPVFDFSKSEDVDLMVENPVDEPDKPRVLIKNQASFPR